jgi:hypothetical protein
MKYGFCFYLCSLSSERMSYDKYFAKDAREMHTIIRGRCPLFLCN